MTDRFAPFRMRKNDLARFHGNDERVAIADYMRAITFYEILLHGQFAKPFTGRLQEPPAH